MKISLINLVRKVTYFCKVAEEKEELPADSKDLSIILKNISQLENFKSRVDYAEKNLKHLSSGSSRVVYETPNGEILKLAKNERGVAQNKAESNPKMKSKFINSTIKSDKNGAWRITHYLDKVTEKEFEQLCDLNFKQFGQAIEFGLQSISKDKISQPKGFDKISQSEIYKELVKIGKEFKLMPADISRISSWGTDGKNPVLLDAGLTKEIYDKFY